MYYVLEWLSASVSFLTRSLGLLSLHLKLMMVFFSIMNDPNEHTYQIFKNSSGRVEITVDVSLINLTASK
jgi:hypothetical protein